MILTTHNFYLLLFNFIFYQFYQFLIERLFPYDAMYNWFSYGIDETDSTLSSNERDYFYKREWSFTIEDDIYIRYQSFRNKAEFKAAIIKRQPHKIDIGAVFTAPPCDHTKINPEKFKPVERELVFDIDMTDYDDIRNCCSGANICLKCWPYMTMALKVVDKALREDFSFKNILWIYSGRRGIHCWVCDPAARDLPNDAREAIVTYLDVKFVSDDDENKRNKRVFQNPMHPSLRRAYSILEPMFEKYICSNDGQGILGDKAKYRKVLNKIPDESVRIELDTMWEKNPHMSGAERWKQLREATSSSGSSGLGGLKRKNTDYAKLEAWRHEFVLSNTYPRLDVNVSKHQNHLLKSPFCVHPKTGRVCVPINPTKADTFNPFSVPTVRILEDEINSFDADTANSDKNVSDLEKTSLKDSIKIFETTFLDGLKDVVGREARDRAEKQRAMQIDF